MTNHWIDIKNADVILVMGANPAENHPVSFHWIMEAREKRGAKLIVVDPRFTRTAARADFYTSLRSGSDIAFLGGMIKYILDNDLCHTDYVVHYTNASFLVNDDFRMPGELEGVFSGYDEENRTYDKSAWAFQTDEKGVVRKDPTLKHPRSVFQLLRKHYDRYDMETVSRVTGTPVADLETVYELFGATGAADKAGTELYAMGWTQHTTGTQNIRAMAIIQLLLGNVGCAGGGINALRGESNVQGSTDHALLFHVLPGYLPMPSADLPTRADYDRRHTPKTVEPGAPNWWGNRPKYLASYLKAAYGAAATPDNDLAYGYLPKIDPGENYSWLKMVDRMDDAGFAGFFAWGQNPACCTSNAGKMRKALAKLDWLVTVNLFDNETSSFWRGPGVNPEEVDTEVFFLPCAVSYEKEGSITNSGRWAQWRYECVAPRGDALPDAEIINRLFYAIGTKMEQKGSPLRRGLHRAFLGLRLRRRRGPAPARGPAQGGPGDQREVLDRRSHQGTAAGLLHTTPGRRLDLLGQLALLRELHREGQHDGAARQGRPDRPGPVPRVGLVLAGQPPDPLQPGLGGPPGRPVGPDPSPHLLERNHVDRGRPRRRMERR